MAPSAPGGCWPGSESGAGVRQLQAGVVDVHHQTVAVRHETRLAGFGEAWPARWRGLSVVGLDDPAMPGSRKGTRALSLS
ncbi:TPA: hypothetical protein ACPZR0_002870 [Yersinia enterocolitica]|nr:hypothetical protein [Yersinia enterocolitica]